MDEQQQVSQCQAELRRQIKDPLMLMLAPRDWIAWALIVSCVVFSVTVLSWSWNILGSMSDMLSSDLDVKVSVKSDSYCSDLSEEQLVPDSNGEVFDLASSQAFGDQARVTRAVCRTSKDLSSSWEKQKNAVVSLLDAFGPRFRFDSSVKRKNNQSEIERF